MSSNPALDQHFERLHAHIESLKAPEIHVHVHAAPAMPAPKKPRVSGGTTQPKPDLGGDQQQRVSSEAAGHPRPYVS